MRALAIVVLLLLAVACGDDSSGSSGGGGVTGLWAWCDDDACSTLDDGGLFFSGGRVLDAFYDADASTYCTYEEVGTYSVQGTTVIVTPADAGAGEEETYTLDGSLLRGSFDLKRVQATAAAASTCPH